MDLAKLLLMTLSIAMLLGHSVDIFYSGVNLKGLSHEIDFKHFDKNLQNLALVSDAAGFYFFRGSNDFLMQKVHLLRLMTVWVGLFLV